jgi:DNA-binding transcriptional LysR family regulator
VDLLAEGFDLAVRAGRLEDSSLSARRIGPTEMVLMASPDYLRSRGRPKAIADLPAHDWVLYRAVGGRAAITLTGSSGPETIEVTGALVADDLPFCRLAVEAGAGIALLPVETITESVVAGRLEQVLPGWSYGGASLFVVLPTSRHVPARVALVRDFLVEALGKLLAESQARCAAARRVGPRTSQAQPRPRARARSRIRR